MLTNPNYTASIEEHEPFDSRLWEKAKVQAREEEELIEEIAKLRRENPSRAVANYRESFKKESESDEEALRRAEAKPDEGMGVSVLGLERQDQVESSWAESVRGLERLKRELPEMVAKGERAERAEKYVLAPEKR
jgi:kinetochor protein Mis14/NSL1